MLTNLWQHPDTGDWIVTFRRVGDHRWTTVGVYGTREEAEEAYARVWQRRAA